MPFPTRMGDEELGKKYDEYRPGMAFKTWQSPPLPIPSRWKVTRSLKAVGWIALGIILFYYGIFRNLEKPEQVHSGRPNYVHNEGNPVPSPRPPTQHGAVPNPLQEIETERSFNGPIKFYELATSLHILGRTRGSSVTNKNVLFAAASLKSAATILPIACEMAIRERNYVHFALMGRDDIPMDILKSVNGITKECKIIFHDARPDYSLQSTEFRMEVSSSAAFNHINTFVHPQATFIDGSGEEEVFFMKGLRARAMSLQRTIIKLPENTGSNLMWITLMDSASLAAWNKVTVDLVVHAQPSASGSLIRLLESLKNADYFSSNAPRLTIELPQNVDEPTRRYLKNYKWPPRATYNDENLLTLHHRIPIHGLKGEENSVRFLESFWPADPSSSHVLILSPQAELSPIFFHYLKYTMLEYRSSSPPALQEDILGISLDLPSAYLNDTTNFSPPLSKQVEPTIFLWQSPNSNAALYFGDKWVELHSFISNLLISQHKLPTPTTLSVKEVGKTYPSWLEHVLMLARVRGYSMIYPNFGGTDTLVTIHTDLYQPPEEYERELQDEKFSKELTGDVNEHLSLKHEEQPLVKTGLLNFLPGEGKLPEIQDMPSLRWDGEVLIGRQIEFGAKAYSKVFKKEIGGCQEDVGPERDTKRKKGEVGDIFCLFDIESPEEAYQ